MKFELEGLCSVVVGQEEDYMQFLDEPNGLVGASGLMPDSVKTPYEFMSALQHADDKEYFAKRLSELRQQTGRQYPAVYRVKIRVEYEPVPDDVGQAAWEAYCKRP